MVLSPLTLRSLLDSLASRLDEARDISRYLVGLLIFLGLLGTFWGLLETVTSVGAAIRALDITSASRARFSRSSRPGSSAPLAGMGLSFSSSLFGLAGSLILGFLDLQASQAQNRFYNELEDWLSTSPISRREGQLHCGAALSSARPARAAAGHRADQQDARRGVWSDAGAGHSERARSRSAWTVWPTPLPALVQQMREEQKIVRQWAQAQTVPAERIARLMDRIRARGVPPPGCVHNAPPRPGGIAVGDSIATRRRRSVTPAITGRASSMRWRSFCWSSPSSCRCSSSRSFSSPGKSPARIPRLPSCARRSPS